MPGSLTLEPTYVPRKLISLLGSSTSPHVEAISAALPLRRSASASSPTLPSPALSTLSTAAVSESSALQKEHLSDFL